MAESITFQDSSPTLDTSADSSLRQRRVSVNEQGWVTYTEDYEPPNFQQEFENSRFIVEIPNLSTELTNGGLNTSWYLLTPKYNFVALQWESFYEIINQVELQSPNIYIENSSDLEYKTYSGKNINENTSKHFNEDLRPSFNFKSPSQLQEMRNVVFTQDYHSEMLYRSRDKVEYPFYVQIDFHNNQNQTHISNALKDLSLYDELVEDYISTDKKTATLNGAEYPVYDLLSWATGMEVERIQFYTIGKAPVMNYAERTVSKSIFSDALNDLIASRQRTLNQILSGENCYSEVLFYKVEKTNISTGQVVQNFWITSKDSAWSMVDTQVRYGQEYTYTQSACVAVLGASVSGGNITPLLRIIEVPLYSLNCNVVQPPQPPPEIKFSNNKNSTKELKISLSLNANNYNEEFVLIEPEDEAQPQVVEKYNIGDLRSDFEYMQERALFELYRIDHHPKLYSDFSGNKIADVRHSSPAISAIFKDKVKMGKEYYYTFRAINSHGLVSNPTPIYKVILNRDADESFLLVEAVELKVEQTTQSNLMFQKLLQLLPSTLQTIYDLQPLRNEDPSTLRGRLDSISLGIAEESIWGKNFKFRITSTDTGKKLDLNIRVKLTTNKTSEDS